jgi:hypothetical protein
MTTLVSEANRPVEDPTRGELVILDSTGDTKMTWDRNSADEVAEMRATFDRMKARGLQAFSVRRNGDKGERITEFDPDAEKIIFASALVGG